MNLCGLSLGGSIAIRVASTAPERVERLALCCTAPSFPPPEQWHERAAAVRSGGMGAVVETRGRARWFSPELARIRPEASRRVEAMLRDCPPEGYAASCEALARHGPGRPPRGGPGADAGRSPAPTTRVSPPERGAETAAAIPGRGSSIIDGARHLANVERPSEFSDALSHHFGARRWMTSAASAACGFAARCSATPTSTGRSSAPPSSREDFQDLITRYAWGEIWARPGLDRRTRSVITLTALVAAGRLEELAMHVRAAQSNGLSDEEIKEVLLQCAIYCGVPAANSAFAVAQRTLDELGGRSDTDEEERE